ncbi:MULTISPECIES: hypothetical protein [Pseudoalteromonas]|uniref:hypothetical protein n=2 Tax=Pseudoalteromonas TaxID=53246 RepID=UPI0016040455|nr:MULTISPECIES: hypothetical protein [unclassified Pseudoalteromonas]MBB1436961.1 hypothetical protein [Pseudoalteromonas sp. SG43-6]MBB1469791.1 hypothetical protein [Pseudoalteromonas sp. SG41-5]
MDCVVKLNISYILKVLIGKLVSDSDSWMDLKTSEEFNLWIMLEDGLKDRIICEKQCMGCLDYHLVNRIFYDFIENIKIINNKNTDLINCLSDKFSLKNEEDPVSLAFELISNPVYVERQLDEKAHHLYKQYVKGVEQVHSALAVGYCQQRMTELHDIIISNSHFGEMQSLSYEDFEVSPTLNTFYLDQNFVSKCVNDKNFMLQVENYKKRSKSIFLSSAYLIEDGIKMNRVFLKSYFELLFELTNNILIAKQDRHLKFFKEQIDSTVERVILWLETTRAAEGLKLYKSLYNNYAYPMFNRKSNITKTLNKDIKVFFADIDDDFHPESFDMEFNSHNIIHGIMISKSYQFTIQDIKKGHVTFDSDFDCMNKIEQLSELMDLINFETESIKDIKKIKSSYQDTEHLKHAWKADYFITDDVKLIKRGEYIYALLGIKTKFLKISDFKKTMVEFYAH